MTKYVESVNKSPPSVTALWHELCH